MGTRYREMAQGQSPDRFKDELDSFVERGKLRPPFRASVDDAYELQRLLDELVELRRRQKLSQAEVARRLGVRQPTVSGFETEDSDPQVSTLQRYARAVGARLRLRVESSADPGWMLASRAGYQKHEGTVAVSLGVVSPKSDLVRAWMSTG